MLTDGVIGWGRWIDATGDFDSGSESWQHMHFVVGMPTPLADMSALQLGNVTATYALMGYTYPTASFDGINFTLGTQPISGSLTANFGSSTIMGNLSVPFGTNVYSSSWGGTIYVGAGSSTFSGWGDVTSTGSDCGGSSCSEASASCRRHASRAGSGLSVRWYGLAKSGARFSRNKRITGNGAVRLPCRKLGRIFQASCMGRPRRQNRRLTR